MSERLQTFIGWCDYFAISPIALGNNKNAV